MSDGTAASEAVPRPAGRALPLGVIFGGITLLAGAAVKLLQLDRLGFPICYFKAATGLPCATCGGTRALAQLASWDVVGALAMNPLVTLGLLGVLAWAAADAWQWSRARRLSIPIGPRAGAVLRIGAVVALLANWIYLLLAGR